MFAQKTWTQFSENWVILPHELREGDRDSTIIKEKRKLPFLRDVLKFHWDKIPDNGIIVFTNTDSCLVKETEQILKKWFLKGRKHCWSCRYDFPKTNYLMKYKQAIHGKFYIGKDLFAFYKNWWETINFPDMLLGCFGWDWLLFRIMGIESEIKPIIYHERHHATWYIDCIGNQWNMKLIRDYSDKYGLINFIKNGILLN